MKVFVLVGSVDHDGEEILGVFSSVEEVLAYVKDKTFWFDRMGYTSCELGQPCGSRRISIDFKRV